MDSIDGIARYRSLLEGERSRLLRLRDALAEGAAEVDRDPNGDPGSGGHLADAGSEMFERSRDLSIAQDIEGQLDDVDHAFARLENGTYGTCEACSREIDPNRLLVRPAARFCLDDQRSAEREAHVR